MNVKSVEKNENSTAKVVLEVEKDRFQTALDKAYRQVKNDIYIPGFRKGKAPRKIVEKMYGTSVFYEDGINVLFPEVWPEACEAADLKAVGNPSIADLNVEEDGTLVLTVETGVYPEVTLGQYKGLEAVKPAVEVTDADVDAEINRLQTRNSSLTTTENAAKDGDTVVIDFEGFDNGVAFDGGKGESYSLRLGSGQFIPGFEDQLVGASAGDERTVNVTFPEDYSEQSLAGHPVVFNVKVLEVKENIAPALDDEFAKDVSETAETMEDLRKELSEKLAKDKAEESEKSFKNDVIQAAMDNMTAIIPDGMVEEQLDNIMQQYSMSMQQSGFSLEQYAQMLGTDVASLREQNREGAVQSIRNTLLLEKVAEVEGLSAADEDIEAEYQKMADEYQMEVEKVKEYVPVDELKREKTYQLAQDLIVNSAVVKAPEAPAAE